MAKRLEEKIDQAIAKSDSVLATVRKENQEMSREVIEAIKKLQ